MTNKKAIPEIRFKGFTEPWEQRKLNELARYTPSPLTVKDINENGYYDLYDANEVIGKTDKSAFFTEYISIIKDGAGVGRVRKLSKNTSILGTMGAIIPQNSNYDFLFYTLEKTDFSKHTSGGTIPHIYFKQYGENIYSIPTLAEQIQIGTFFANLDNLITLHQRKYEKLHNIKKSMLEKMFPKNGSNVPEIRFKGFTDAWEQRKFSDLVQIERGGSPRPIDDFITNSPDGLNWVKIGDAPAQGNRITKTAEKIRPEGLSKTREVHPGDLILSNSMSFGKPYIMGIDGCIHDGWLLIRNTYNIFDLTFLCHLLGTPQMLNQYRSLAAGSTVNNLNKELVGNTVVTIPKIDEQRVLGQYLEQLDRLITLHQRELKKLQNIKKSMLEKMFV